MRLRIPFTIPRYDVNDPEVWKRLPEISWWAEGREGAWPLRGSRPRDKSGPRPPSNGRRTSSARPT
jgi:hypothetical protein